ncbi:MAG: histidine phosphatase family protein [Cyclobacteriaceae bacterium]|nr:histidine phosphatase family protein [Cyclobacteriaceae bacterium]MCK5209574.1 histidine phosphatase family protein [Cyclobacteriaceae bacterium]MCK5280939.1 histidine phosphatase family protein [Cyclobacteriaceae bacterium]MCK5371879.1 histidine phosphatase family protein [Cyclobacteriaceae bacterium]MCK5469364.1 histidine phosphatase family protein [Cyclobacteriaceae bacterium]
MGKTLFIVRHAAAKPTEAGEKDIDRKLAADGMQQSSRLGAYIYKKNTDISAIVCSSAIRAIQTAELISDQINFDILKIQIHSELYEASVRIIFKEVCEFNNDWNEVIVVGHNPVVSYFVEYLTGHHFDGMEAGSLVKIYCGVDDWALVSNENSSFEYYVSPDDVTIEN